MTSITTDTPLEAGMYDVVHGNRNGPFMSVRGGQLFIGVLPVRVRAGEYKLYGRWA